MRTGRWGHALIACALIVATACGGGGPKSTSGNRTDGVNERAVSFKTSDGVRLTGRLFGSGRIGLTLAHMYPADATSWYPAARKFAQAGYMALAFNFRGYADSQGPKNIPKTPLDIAAAMNTLKRNGAKDVVFIGASLGGTASIVAAETQNPLAVVAVSAPLRFMGLDAVVSTTHVQRPVLLMAARDDASGAFDALQQFARDLPSPETKVYGGDAHGTNLLSNRPGAVDVIITFLRRWAPVKTPRTEP